MAASLIGCTRQGQSPAYLDAGNTGGAMPGPMLEPVSTAAPDAPPPQRPEIYDHHGATLRMKTLVRHGYGCGGQCAFNRRGQSTVELTWTGDGYAEVRDDGDMESSTADRGGLSSTRRAWRLSWIGTWTGDDTRRTIVLERRASSCNVSVQGRDGSATETCAGAPDRLELTCAWEVPQADGQHAAQRRPGPTRAWVCRADPPLGRYPGTDLPWAFAPTTLERRTAGEPVAETTYEIRRDDEAR